MPRVGSSRTRTRQRRSSQRAKTSFCWLPPLNSPAGCAATAPSRASAAIRRLTARSLAARADQAGDHRPAQHGRARRSTRCGRPTPRRRSSRSPVRAARRARRPRIARCTHHRRTGAPEHEQLTRGRVGAAPANAEAISDAPDPTTPARPTISPGSDGEIDVGEGAVDARPDQLEQPGDAGVDLLLVVLAVVVGVAHATDHQLVQPAVVDALVGEVVDDHAVLEHDDPRAGPAHVAAACATRR